MQYYLTFADSEDKIPGHFRDQKPPLAEMLLVNKSGHLFRITPEGRPIRIAPGELARPEPIEIFIDKTGKGRIFRIKTQESGNVHED